MKIRDLPIVLKATALGAGVMYICDPELGRRRRALARDKMIRFQKAIQEASRVTMRDLRNRTLGTIAEGRATFFDHGVDDDVLADRVRSKLGFLVRHPSSIEVKASEGRVTLTGPVLADEIQQLIDGVRSIRGVRNVENSLSVHETNDNVPGLQGDLPKPKGELVDVFQDRWSPSTRFLVGTAGLMFLLGFNPFRRSAASLSILVGLGLAACSSMAENERLPRSPSGRD